MTYIKDRILQDVRNQHITLDLIHRHSYDIEETTAPSGNIIKLTTLVMTAFCFAGPIHARFQVQEYIWCNRGWDDNGTCESNNLHAFCVCPDLSRLLLDMALEANNLGLSCSNTQHGAFQNQKRAGSGESQDAQGHTGCYYDAQGKNPAGTIRCAS